MGYQEVFIKGRNNKETIDLLKAMVRENVRSENDLNASIHCISQVKEKIKKNYAMKKDLIPGEQMILITGDRLRNINEYMENKSKTANYTSSEKAIIKNAELIPLDNIQELFKGYKRYIYDMDYNDYLNGVISDERNLENRIDEILEINKNAINERNSKGNYSNSNPLEIEYNARNSNGDLPINIIFKNYTRGQLEKALDKFNQINQTEYHEIEPTPATEMQKTNKYANWGQKKQIEKEDLDQRFAKMSNDFKLNPEHLAEVIAFSSKFHNYSARNANLIYMQNKGATFVGSYNKFKELGYNVKRGEKGLNVLVPTITTYFEIGDEIKNISQANAKEKAKIKSGEIKTKERLSFKYGAVFDISQTTCPTKDYPKYYDVGYSSTEHQKAYDDIVAYAKNKLDCQVITDDLKSISIKGKYYIEQNNISINDKLEDTQKLSVLSHELGHAILHNKNTNANEKSTAQIEMEADVFSILMQSHIDIELTESRKKHFTENYRALQSYNEKQTDETKKVDFDKLYDNVFNEYKNAVKGINEITAEQNVSIKNKNVEVEF